MRDLCRRRDHTTSGDIDRMPNACRHSAMIPQVPSKYPTAGGHETAARAEGPGLMGAAHITEATFVARMGCGASDGGDLGVAAHPACVDHCEERIGRAVCGATRRRRMGVACGSCAAVWARAQHWCGR